MLEVRVLGPIEAHDDGTVVVLGSRAQRVLLAALAHARGQVVQTGELVRLVWDGRAPSQPEGALKSHVSRLRRVLGHDVLVSRSGGYALRLDAGSLDLDRFERGLEPGAMLPELDAALQLWRGRPYGDLADHEHVAGDVARLSELRSQGQLRRAELLLADHRDEEAVAAFVDLVTEEPLREAAWIGLLRSLHGVGRQADAIAQARRYREVVRETGLEPSPSFLAAERAVFSSPPSAAAPRRGAAPLPVRLASLVGRDREVEELCELARHRRLVTVTGPGGVGKTSLAVTVAHRAADGLEGAWVVPLAEVDAADAVVAAIVRAVGTPASGPLDDALVRHLTGRRVLLVLDNAEHVLPAVRGIVERLVATADGVRFLITSRQPLQVAGELVVPLRPLEQDAAVQLLHERARDAGAPIPSEQRALAIEVCERLDRLPLAIEMAAGRLRGLGLEELAAHLDSRPELLRTGATGRHGTLASVVGWSYDLLDPHARSLLDQLSVFAGPFDVGAAAAVWDGTDVVGGIADLVDRSMVHRVEADDRTRFTLLQTVRSFAGARLADSSASDATVRWFIRYHRELAEQIGTGLRGAEEPRWAERLEAELANLEAAHGHAIQRGDLPAAVALATAFHPFVYHRLRADVGAWAERTLTLAELDGHPGRAAVAAVVAVNRLHRGDLDAVEPLLVDLPDDPVARHAHEVLGDLQIYRGRFSDSLTRFHEAERLAELAGDRFTVLHSRMSQAMAMGYAGDLEDGLALVEEVRREAVEARLALIAAWCDFTEGELLAERHPRQALALVDRTVEEADRHGWRMLAGVGRLTASSLRARTADPTDAIPGFERLVRHWVRHGDDTHQWTTLRNLIDLLIRLDAHTPAARLLGAVSAAPRPTFGAEEQRLASARAVVLRHLGDEGASLIRQGCGDDLPAAVELALDALAVLRARSATS